MRTNRLLTAVLLALLVVPTLGMVAAPATAATQPVDEGECGPIDSYETTDAYWSCLVEHTSKDEVLAIINEAPSNSSQTEIDAVYAVYPKHADSYNFTDRQESKIADWMGWEKLGIKPAWASENQTSSGESGDDSGRLVRTADLAIQQESYIESDVQRLSSNGTPVYSVAGERVQLVPTNFETGTVQDFGVVGSAGKLTFDSTFDEFTFRPTTGTGTYEMYWIVEEEVATQNGTRTATVRYTAKLRVTGQTDMVHQKSGALAKTKQQADNWEEFNSTLHENNLFVGPGVSTEEAVQNLLDWGQLHPSNAPLKALAGGFVPYIILGVTSAGAALVWAIYNGYHAIIVTYLKRRLNIHEAVEAEEGTAAERLERLDKEERKRLASQWTPYDIESDDHAADAMADAFGENLLEAGKNFQTTFLPRNVLKNRLKAMGQSGWVVVKREPETDGGHGNTVIEAELQKEETLDDVDGEVVELNEDIPDEIVYALDWSVGSPLHQFDLPNADYDANAAEVEFDVHDVDELAERFRADMRHFDSEEAFAKYLLEFAEAVRRHPLTDPDGSVNGIHYTLETLFKQAQVFDEDLNWPGMHYIVDAIERALVDYDPETKALRVADEVRNGGA